MKQPTDSAVSHLSDSLQRLQVLKLLLIMFYRTKSHRGDNLLAIFKHLRFMQKNCLSLKEKVSEMRKKQDINLAGKKDLDRQVSEMKDLENHIKNQVRITLKICKLDLVLRNLTNL